MLYVDAAARLVDGLRVVLCRRDLLDTSVSCLFQSFGPYYAFTDHPAWMGHAARSLSALMDRWRDRPPCAVHELVHETLLDDPEGELRRLLAFLDLPWDPAVLEFHRLDREVHTASTAQVREPLHRRAVGRGRRYLPWAQELVAALEGGPAPG
ncbi:MAG: sulfotransferase [bacterium]